MTVNYTNKEKEAPKSFEEILLNYEREIAKNDRLYIHDLDSYIVGAHNCLTIPLNRVTGYLSTSYSNFLKE